MRINNFFEIHLKSLDGTAKLAYAKMKNTYMNENVEESVEQHVSEDVLMSMSRLPVLVEPTEISLQAIRR